MNAERLGEAANDLLHQAGFSGSLHATTLHGGANNRVYRVDTDRGPVVVKAYFRHPADPWDRLHAEWSFARFAWDAGIRALAEPLAVDFEAGVAAYAYIDGRPLCPSDVDADAIAQALTFFNDLNRHRAAAGALQPAAEACFSLGEHLRTIDGRVCALQRIEAAEPEDASAAAFVRDSLAPAWTSIRRTIEVEHPAGLEDPLDPAFRCVSPSDFGFHNALRLTDGKLTFVDFEYAGWDDPAKMVCDFFNQVAVPVPLDAFEAFVAGAATAVDDRGGALAKRASLLMPAYTVKWCCILLNEFRAVASERRRYAQPRLDANKSEQLRKARTLFGRLQLARTQTL
ncbi:MAG TPA: phosphotransferase [Candidatus Baltobacteraceae bacterium]|nr:phosphotransferase [Candidatus Baltobacteraceae bacterium]